MGKRFIVTIPKDTHLQKSGLRQVQYPLMSISTNCFHRFIVIMQSYEVRISQAAFADMADLRAFLKAMMTEEGAIRYANNMRAEIKMLSEYADCYGTTTSKYLRLIHPKARRMVSHNRRWIYVFHIESSFVIVDRILPAKIVK